MSDVKRIIIPVDFMQYTHRLVDYGLCMAQKLGMTVQFIHVADLGKGNDAMLGVPISQSMEKQLLANAKEKMTDLVQDSQEKVQGCTGNVVSGDTVDQIIDFAGWPGVDLIIIGTHGARGLEKILLGSTAERIVKRSPCPVLIMNPCT
ncbi:MAG: universal stress protein [Desulfobulbaceae bacterium]|uniref:Universal stress protein n=1 Tax=Candidatus Desulfatifera sulfidica TaxID=2841691 RepID=A0A8J6N746_9BACT|nr:universal stress protein [Candidatus Desulfatifera sulfidica]